MQPRAEAAGFGAIAAARGGGVGVEEEEGARAEGGLPLEDGLAVEEVVGDVKEVLAVDVVIVRVRWPCEEESCWGVYALIPCEKDDRNGGKGTWHNLIQRILCRQSK